MKKVSKGTTLVEIMVSIALISFVMIFIFGILADMKNEDELASKRNQDSINRATFTRLIQNDFISGLVGVSRTSKCTYEFTFSNGNVKTLKVESNYVVYDGEKWQLSQGAYELDKETIIYECRKNADNTSNFHVLKILIPSTKNVASNRVYDIELVHSSIGTLTLSGLDSFLEVKPACN